MADPEPNKRVSLSDFLKPGGHTVVTESLGPVTVYPVTVAIAQVLETKFGEKLDAHPAPDVFDAYLGLSASKSPHADTQKPGLSDADVTSLTPFDKDVLAQAAMGDFDDAKSQESRDPVRTFVTRLATQGESIRENSLQLQKKLQSIGLGYGSATKKALDQSLRHGEMIQRALGPLAGIRDVSSNLDRITRAAFPNSGLTDAIEKYKTSFPHSSALRLSERLHEHDVVAPIASFDPGKRVREHQARLEKAGDKVIELANVAVVRINDLVEFAEKFHLDSAKSGRKNIGIAMAALLVSAALSLFQSVYQIHKDTADSPRGEEQMKLLRESNAAAQQEIVLLRRLLDGAQQTRATPSASLSAAPSLPLETTGATPITAKPHALPSPRD